MVMSRIQSAFQIMRPTFEAPPEDEVPLNLYRMQRAYYHSNGLYDQVQSAARALHLRVPAMMPLRNPANRVVEFYVPHIWPEAEEIESDNEALVEAIEKVWKWSNWDERGLYAARSFAMLGDLFIKVHGEAREGRDARVFYQVIEPEEVTDFETDLRGYLTWILIEVEKVRRGDGGKAPRTYWACEEWDKATQTHTTWETDSRGDNRRANVTTTPFSAYGIDFIPIGQAQFRDVGQKRGHGAFTHAIDKIDEANRSATRLHQMLYRHNDAIWALQSAGRTGLSGTVAAPRIVSAGGLPGGPPGDDDPVLIGGESVVRLPGGTELQSLVPNINYEQALAVLSAHMRELEYDLPEMGFYQLREQQGEVSGVALRLLMGPALEKAQEARRHGHALLERLDEMAITIGRALRIPEFLAVGGSYEDGDWEHGFDLREIIPMSSAEQAAVDMAVAQAAIEQQASGLSEKWTLRDRGFSDEEIEDMEAEKAEDAEKAQARFNAGLGAGQPPAFGGDEEPEDEDEEPGAPFGG